jgi:predicted AlkP superfamily phosphohydrolase/phosphomutase
MTPRRGRLLVVGLDAATPGLVRRWAEEGHLPVMARLMAEGAWSPLRSVPNMFTPAAWTTFMCGTNPGRHGIFSFAERLPGSYQQRFVNGSTRDGVPFWRLLDREGFRVGVFNVPMTYPAEKINGFMLSGMDAPHPHAPGFAYPSNLVSRLQPALGRLEHKHSGAASKVGHAVLRGHTERALSIVLESLETRTRWAEYLLQEYLLDVCVIVFTETDTAQHYFWKYLDPRHPHHLAESAARHGHSILRVYQKADEALGRLIGAFGEDATIMVLSDHGGGIAPTLGTSWLLKTFLSILGLYAEVGSRNGHDGGGSRRRIVRRLYEAVNPHLPGQLKVVLRSRAPRLFSAFKSHVRGETDWSHTRAYVIGAYDGGIYINLKGREPQGIVEPGREYEELRSQIIEQLNTSVDPVTDTRIVERACRREDVYAGPYVDRAPDICVTLRDGFFHALQVGSARADFPFTKPADPGDVISGSHRPDGLVILKDRAIAPGAPLEAPTLADIAPTILYALDCPVPQGLDGRVLLEAFGGASVRRPVRWTSAAVGSADVHGYSPTDQAIVEQRLRALGYF